MIQIHKPFRAVLLGVLMVGSFGLSQQALAHKLNLFAYAEGDTISVEGYFADGRKAQNSAVKVLDSSGKVLVEGMTDGEGKYLFKVPQKSDIKIILNAGMGHQGEFAMSAAELGDGNAAASEQGSAMSDGDADVGHAGAEVVNAPVVGGELDIAVHRAVNEAIKPLVRELAESRQQASISEIVGAVGYIFGLLGLFAFYKARQASGKTTSLQQPESGR